jgi:hypothetical protein
MKNPLYIVLACIAALVLGVVAVRTHPYWTHGEKVVHVTGVATKNMMDHGKMRDVYLVFTTDETYKNVDSPSYFKFNSSDLQGKLIQTGCFKIDYYGFRIPFMSKYRNITKAVKTDCPAGM